MGSRGSGLTPADLRVIVVEDSFVVAQQLGKLLERAGFAVVGLAGSSQAAFELIDRVEFDVAVLDIMLGGRSVKDVALTLHGEGRPIVFLSGYADLGMLPASLRGLPRLAKPVEPALLVRAIVQAACDSTQRPPE